jgi:cysteinyl-tRNA synthetase
MNLTDFGHLTDDADAGEDKMMKGLRREGKPITLQAMRDLSDDYIAAFMNDLAELNMLPADTYSRASDYVREQIALIKTLEAKGYTYETSDGVYFDISKFPTYGKLGNVDVAQLKEGARVEVNPEKHHPADFALWKKGLLGWESAWGKGFPGWHIECTAMAFATLGRQIDIHTGGEDLKYTHHNGEIAQAEAATGKCTYVGCWFHNSFITIDGTKISKSLGNTISLHNLEDCGYSADTFRYWVLTSHYRSGSNFSFEALDGAKQALFRLKRYLIEEYKDAKGVIHESYKNRFMEAVADDLNTPKAIAILWELVKDSTVSAGDKAATLRDFDKVIAIGLSDERDEVVRELGIMQPEEVPPEVQELLDKREIARATRNWEEADHIREALNLQGYVVEDTPQGQRVSKVV